MSKHLLLYNIAEIKEFKERSQKFFWFFFYRNQEATKLVAQWEMQLSDKLAKIPARVLEPEKIIFGEGKFVSINQT